MEVNVKKIKRNQVVITGFAIMIAIAGYINYTGNLSDIISVKSKYRQPLIRSMRHQMIY